MPHFPRSVQAARATVPGKRRGRSGANRDAPLFAFHSDTERRAGPSAKRRPKAVARFDPHSYDDDGAAAGGACRVGHGFNCPRCAAVCSYDSRACGGCRLECYYEAGVGVVTLGERCACDRDDRLFPKRRRAGEGVGEEVSGRSTKKKKGGNNIARISRRKSNETSAPADGPLSGDNDADDLRVASVKPRKVDDAHDIVPTAEPAEGFPTGWVTRRFPRGGSKGGKRYDRCWYSPVENYKFRYKYEARSFLEELERTEEGGEAAAMFWLKRRRAGRRCEKPAAAARGGSVIASDENVEGRGAKEGACTSLESELQTATNGVGDGGDTVAKENEGAEPSSLEEQLAEARSQISAALGEKAALTDALRLMRAEARKREARISELESLVKPQIALDEETIADERKMPAAVAAASESEWETTPARLCTEIGSEDAVDQLRERNRELTAENAKMTSELTSLKAKYTEAKKALEETSASSNARISELSTQVFRLTAERDELAKRAKEAMADEVSAPKAAAVSPEATAQKFLVNRELQPETTMQVRDGWPKERGGRDKTATDPYRMPSFAFGSATKASNGTSTPSNARIAEISTSVSRLTGKGDEPAKRARDAALNEVPAPKAAVSTDKTPPQLPRNRGPRPKTTTPEKEGRRRKQGGHDKRATDPNRIPLFAFAAADEDSGATGRPKRRLKRVRRFDPTSSDERRGAKCKIGHGFDCPECNAACSYDARVCEACGLACCYEAGVGAVALEERRGVSSSV